MKRMFSRALLLLSGIAVLLLSACSKAPEQGKHIPKTAALVLGINSKQIQEKLVTEGLTVDKLFEAVQQKDTSNEMAKALKEAENSGVDLKGDVFVAMVPGDKGNGYVMAVAKLKDAAKFETFLKEKSKKEIKAGKDFKFMEDEDGAVGFNNETIIGVFSFDANKFGGDAYGPENDPFAALGDSAAPAAPKAPEKANAPEILDGLFHLKADESVGTIESFKAVQKEKGDVLFWMSSEQIYAFNPGTPSGVAALVSTNVKKLTAGSFQTAAVHFENGKIKVNSNAYAGTEMKEIMKKYPMEKVNMSMLETYPSDNVLGFVLMNFDLRMLGDILKLVGMDGFANMGLAEAGITLDDVLKAFKGEFALIGSDFSVVSQPSAWDSTYKTTKPQAKWVFNLKVGDKAAFEKIMSSPRIAPMFTKKGNEYVPNEGLSGEMGVSISNERILLSSDAELMAAYAAGKGKVKLDEGIESKAKGNVMSMYFSIEKMVNNIPAEEMKVPDSVLNDIKGLLKDFTVATEPYNGTSQKSTIELNFKNEGQNTLVQLANFTQKMYSYYLSKKKEDEAAWGEPAIDSAAVAVPVDTTAAAVAQ
ncbi:DUF4836 family protein [Chitinophaga lutea]|uniref:DUF4836 family protein n=1 Tax=Chitinophaga lutea TaxID=2488634 RepID=A0A3N4QPZ6_9BACT|nr:DUF4836 family protein [Chitinophaga lutea]RPE13694.1 DUF4836 family protein [Chitinophaga lutea]